jgi:branched-chain amino acid transport system ATP-binding protein
VTLLGPNGAGKSSTLRAISRLQPYSGVISFDGVNLKRKHPEQVAAAGLIHVPEGRRVFPTLTVHENLQIGVTAAHGRVAEYPIDAVYDLFPMLVPLRRRPGYTLSGGEQQMVALGRALTGAPRMLLLDEPSLGLSPIMTKVVFGVLAEVRGRTPLLVVEQNTTMALSVSDHASVLASGSIRMSGTPAELSDRERMLASFLGQTEAL